MISNPIVHSGYSQLFASRTSQGIYTEQLSLKIVLLAVMDAAFPIVDSNCLLRDPEEEKHCV